MFDTESYPSSETPSSEELLPTTQCVYVKIDKSMLKSFFVNPKPVTFTYDANVMTSSGFERQDGIASTPVADGQIPGSFIKVGEVILVIPMEDLDDSNFTTRVEDSQALLVNISKAHVKAFVASDLHEYERSLIPSARGFTLKEWIEFRNPGEVSGGLSILNYESD